MTVNHTNDQLFLERLTAIISTNLKNNQFGVSELAREMNLSRSHLHRRLKSLTNHSASQFICKVRLEKAMQLLRENGDSASEIAYNVGFNSPTYFSRCFNNYYGFPPGEVKKQIPAQNNDESGKSEINRNQLDCNPKKLSRKGVFLFSAIGVFVFALVFISYAIFINGGIFPYNLSNKERDLSIIVLPFENLNDHPNNVHFADGIREDILNNLYWITSLRVVSRTSAEQFRGTSLSTQEIAKKMKVRYVLEGSVRQDGNKVRISIQLIDSYIEDHLWSSFFDRTLDNIIGVQDEIALKVASSLKTVLSENEIQNIEKVSTQNSKAYDYYLQARFLLHKTTSELRSGFDKTGVVNCIKYYEMAIAEDENFAEAYAGLANASFNLSAWGFIPTNEGFIKARKLSLKALEIDPDCAEAHSVLGAFYVWGTRSFEEGRKEYEAAIRLNPNFATARQGYAQFLMITGPIEEARRQVNYAINLEPNFWVVQNLNSWIYYFEGKYNQALEACLLAADYNPDFSSNKWLFVLNYAKLGEGEKMKEELRKIARQHSGTDDYSEGIENAYDEAGIEGLFKWLIDINKNNPIKIEGMNGHPFFIAWWNAILGNEEEAVFWLEQTMLEKRKIFHYFNLICTNPDFEFLHKNPRFLKVVDDIGLAPYHNRKGK